MRARPINLALRQRFLTKPASGKLAFAAGEPLPNPPRNDQRQRAFANQQRPASASPTLPPLNGSSYAPYNCNACQNSSVGMQGSNAAARSSARASGCHAASLAERADGQHLSSELAQKHASPPTVAPHGLAPAAAAACSVSIAAHPSSIGQGGSKLPVPAAKPMPVSGLAAVIDLTASNTHQPLKQTGGLHAGGNAQQHASSNAVRQSASLPRQGGAQQSRTEPQPSSSSRSGNFAALRQHATAQLGVRLQATPALSKLPQQAAAQPMQQSSRPQAASAPSAPMQSHGTGVFSVCDSDDDDFMPSKLLADISKAASAPSASTAHQGREPAAGPQG